jgi:hypothetical protein
MYRELPVTFVYTSYVFHVCQLTRCTPFPFIALLHLLFFSLSQLYSRADNLANGILSSSYLITPSFGRSSHYIMRVFLHLMFGPEGIANNISDLGI